MLDHTRSGEQSGGTNGEMAPGIQGRGDIQIVKLQKLKCCNSIIFPICKATNTCCMEWS